MKKVVGLVHNAIIILFFFKCKVHKLHAMIFLCCFYFNFDCNFVGLLNYFTCFLYNNLYS